MRCSAIGAAEAEGDKDGILGPRFPLEFSESDGCWAFQAISTTQLTRWWPASERRDRLATVVDLKAHSAPYASHLDVLAVIKVAGI